MIDHKAEMARLEREIDRLILELEYVAPGSAKRWFQRKLRWARYNLAALQSWKGV